MTGSTVDGRLHFSFAELSALVESFYFFIISVTENEIHSGILTSKTKDNSAMWFYRNITDIDDVYLNLNNTDETGAKRKLLSRYMGKSHCFDVFIFGYCHCCIGVMSK